MKKRFVSTFIIFILILNNFSGTSYGATNNTAALDNMTAGDVLQWNKTIRAQYPTEGEALAYFLLPSDNLTYYNRGIQSSHPEIVSKAQAITNGLATDYDKAKAIHQWVAGNIAYDWDLWTKVQKDQDWNHANEMNTAINTLQRGRGLCSGFTNLNVALLRAAGIPAKYVNGYYFPEDGNYNHAWYEAFVGGRWIMGDTTTDRNGDFENGAKVTHGPGRTATFDLSIEEMSKKYRIFTGVLYTRKAPATEIVLSSKVNAVENWTFLEHGNLKSVYIPGNVKAISENAFRNTSNLTIYGVAGSAAEAFAGQKGITFVATVEIDFPDIPLADVEEALIDFPEVPLANAPQGGFSLATLMLMVLIGISLFGLAIMLNGSRREDM